MEEFKNGKVTEHRITKAETQIVGICDDIDSLKDDVKLILTNHLPHLKTDVESLSRLVKIVGAGIFLSIAANIIISLIK